MTSSYKLKGGKKGGKKCFVLVALLLIPLFSHAQNFKFQSFLNVRAVLTGTNSVGTAYGVTNLSAIVTNVGMIHSTNVVWTNNNGNVVRSAASGTNSITTASLFRDVPLWADREGRTPILYGPYVADPTANATNYPKSALTLFVKVAGNWNTNGPIGINFAPIWDGDNALGTSGTTPTTYSEDWSVVIPGGWFTTLATNVPVWRWPGARALRLRFITNQFGGGISETAVTNSPAIVTLGIGGYIP